MSLKIIAPVEFLRDPRRVRETLLADYSLDITHLIEFVLEQWDLLEDIDRDVQREIALSLIERHCDRKRIRMTFNDLYEAGHLLLDGMQQVHDAWSPLIVPVTSRLVTKSSLHLQRFVGWPTSALIELRPIIHETQDFRHVTDPSYRGSVRGVLDLPDPAQLRQYLLAAAR